MRTRFGFVAIAVWMLSTPAPTDGHHSAAAEFDRAKPITITGAVTKIDWMNPHAIFYMDATENGDTIANWGWELPSPNQLIASGVDANLDENWGSMPPAEANSPRPQSRPNFLSRLYFPAPRNISAR